jgi:hypothetical protein
VQPCDIYRADTSILWSGEAHHAKRRVAALEPGLATAWWPSLGRTMSAPQDGDLSSPVDRTCNLDKPRWWSLRFQYTIEARHLGNAALCSFCGPLLSLNGPTWHPRTATDTSSRSATDPAWCRPRRRGYSGPEQHPAGAIRTRPMTPGYSESHAARRPADAETTSPDAPPDRTRRASLTSCRLIDRLSGALV